MSTVKVNMDWKGGTAFETDLNGHKLIIDAPSAAGGNDLGPTPKPLMLVALAGCTGIDVASILKKMRVEFEALKVWVEAEQTETYPKHYSSMRVVYEFKGKDLPMAKLEKAVKLSEEQYCGVSYIYKKAIPLTSEIRVVE
ncbi:MAG: OsmC family protein [Bacteroidales bacterium]|nr:OsmC family protein [Bacteroidales bacterium]